MQDRYERSIQRSLKKKKLPYKKVGTGEYAPLIINAMETNVPFRFNGNVINKEASLINKLPKGCCVEVPIFVDNHGLYPHGGIVLPTIYKAVCTSNIMV